VRVHHNRPARGLVADQIRQLRQTAQDVLLEEHNSSLRSSRSFEGVPDNPNSVAKEVYRIQRRDDRRDVLEETIAADQERERGVECPPVPDRRRCAASSHQQVAGR
jgi:hypothetical protein